MRKSRVKAIKNALTIRRPNGIVIAPNRSQLRKAKRAYTRARSGRTHATNVQVEQPRRKRPQGRSRRPNASLALALMAALARRPRP